MNYRSQLDLTKTLNSLLDMRMVPILNGNDAVATVDSNNKNVNISSDLTLSCVTQLFVCCRWFRTTTSSLRRWPQPCKLTYLYCCQMSTECSLVGPVSPNHG